MDKHWGERFSGIDRLYGLGTVARLSKCRVAVIGMGGVGSWIVEALARSAVGHMNLIDADDICISNTNRQLPALIGQYGRNKAHAMAERCRAINPMINVSATEVFLTVANMETLLGQDFNLIIDASDSFRIKVEAIAWCRHHKRPLITIGAAGGRTEPTLVRVRDISRTEHDTMLALIRKKLRSEFNFPRNPKRYFGVPAVYSLENVKYPQADGSVCGVRPPLRANAALKLDCNASLGAATHVTGAFAFAATGKAIEMLLKLKKINA
ncbi:tRNA threonylcarbamoyladenosine dehydratase [Xylella taiwanensis]|uniref:tRNA threonylcarbamoyladenosine dehydratase n=2 Tax=Xylella taiwanensis TaxID=1444770 RepID=A0ABS8TTG6_9GAMM|nr:tRNA threonylcarbamoyladenosine dehydratase [Xylella taiwanensis]AXI83831.1 thiamine biosynthesis protein ThiF [Xylella taiwanensis]MCD8456933.1 tRNA threonylcarbamoyladenosine dehydratase [Xylella taiwanensis]MCD8459344.1 tRNA threonylcarbamoyladenosine dehydratase [Xylella taiwanensis]MCD8461785.1 tRNA threonylcarbamoyladenosine dehydratase [Xylella taiwanensis]MCD8462182.1 tRNA threonylcarbamoyladenosine dehydratase [Xylella taiwanensis]